VINLLGINPALTLALTKVSVVHALENTIRNISATPSYWVTILFDLNRFGAAT